MRFGGNGNHGRAHRSARADRGAFGVWPLGGDAQIAARITEGNLDAVIFFRDPMGKHPHEPDVNMLLRQCDVHNVALATNRAGGVAGARRAFGRRMSGVGRRGTALGQAATPMRW